RPNIGERRADPALRCDRVAAGWKDLADAGRLQSRDGHPESGAQTCTTRTDHHDVVTVLGDLVSRRHQLAPRAMPSTAKMPATAKPKQSRRVTTRRPSLASSVWT